MTAVLDQLDALIAATEHEHDTLQTELDRTSRVLEPLHDARRQLIGADAPADVQIRTVQFDPALATPSTVTVAHPPVTAESKRPAPSARPTARRTTRSCAPTVDRGTTWGRCCHRPSPNPWSGRGS